MNAARRRRNSTRIDEDGNVLWHGVKLGEYWKTDMQVAINNSNRRKDAFFSICLGKAGTSMPYQQSIPMDFARCYENLFHQKITLEGPTGQTWPTIIRNFHQVVRFGKGWRQFSVANNLREGHQLLFTLVGKFRFKVQFFDQLGKRCTSYPPLPGAQSGSLAVVAETEPVVDGGQASHRHGSEAQTSAAVPLMGTSPNSATSLSSNSDPEDNVILRQCGPDVPGTEASLPHEHRREREEHFFDARNGSEGMETDDEGNQELDEAQIYIFQGDDTDEVPIKYHPPATMQPRPTNPERNIHTLNEISRGKQPVFRFPDNQAQSPQIQDHNNSPSSGEELPFQYYPEMWKKPVAVNRPPLVASSHEARGSSGSSPAMRVLQQQACTRFSKIVLKCERRDVSDQERRVVVEAAKRFVSALENEKFLVVMREEQVYHTFHLEIPGKILEATGTKHTSKVEVCLMDREQAQYKAYWTRQNSYDAPLLDRDAWAKFAVDHTLEEGDVCVFQLLQSKPAFFFCVHIFRVVETPGTARLLRCNRQ